MGTREACSIVEAASDWGRGRGTGKRCKTATVLCLYFWLFSSQRYLAPCQYRPISSRHLACSSFGALQDSDARAGPLSERLRKAARYQNRAIFTLFTKLVISSRALFCDRAWDAFTSSVRLCATFRSIDMLTASSGSSHSRLHDVCHKVYDCFSGFLLGSGGGGTDDFVFENLSALFAHTSLQDNKKGFWRQ